MNILGISCFYHDSAASLVVDGQIIAAAEEERFSRQKHDNSFPKEAIQYCLSEGDLGVEDIDKVVYYEKPIDKFNRILNNAADVFPKGYRFFSHALPEWIGAKLRIRKILEKEFSYNGKVEFVQHHVSHAASAFYPSPFDEAAILTVDGVGEKTTNQMFHAGEEIRPIKHIEFPDSIGLLYSTITSYLGYRVNNGEYKVMGLASYGEPIYEEEFREIVDIDEDGSYSLNQKYFSYRYSEQMWSKELESLFGEPREQGASLNQRHKDIAATLQKIIEKILVRQVNHLYDITDTENLCMAGGVALNSAANGRLKEDMPFENIWIQPAAGDSGGAIGAALQRSPERNCHMDDVYLGPSYSSSEIKQSLVDSNADFDSYEQDGLVDAVVDKLVDGEVLGLFQGRLEWGPRALGNRSIIADPRNSEVKDIVNKKIKFREDFRPFAPTVLEEYAPQYFELGELDQSPFMLFVVDVKEDKRDLIPAVVHKDGTSRIQTLKRNTNPLFYDITKEFYNRTGVPVLLNTSFNLRGMPIVRTPKEAYECFKNSGLDAIVTEDFIVED